MAVMNRDKNAKDSKLLRRKWDGKGAAGVFREKGRELISL